MLQHQWRVTKYDPALRTSTGLFTGDEWILFSQLGSTIDSELLTPERYLWAEDRYVDAVERFLAASEIEALMIEGLQTGSYKPNDVDRLGLRSIPVAEGQVLSATGEIGHVCRLNLREHLWCRLQAEGAFFVHFGWDYYMFVGSSRPCEDAIAETIAAGLFVEPAISPYHNDAED